MTEHNKRSCKMAAAEIRRKENEREQQLRAEAERKRLEEEVKNTSHVLYGVHCTSLLVVALARFI